MENNQMKPGSEITAEEYDNLIMVLEGILSSSDDFIVIVENFYRTLRNVFYCESKNEACQCFTNATENHQRKKDGNHKQIVQTLKLLTSCMYCARNLDFKEQDNPQENVRLSSIKSQLVTTITINHAKYATRFKQERIRLANTKKRARATETQTEAFCRGKKTGGFKRTKSGYSRNHQPKDPKRRTHTSLTSNETANIKTLYSDLCNYTPDEKE